MRDEGVALPDPWADTRVRRDLLLRALATGLALLVGALVLDRSRSGAQPLLVMSSALLLLHHLLRASWRLTRLRPPLLQPSAVPGLLALFALVFLAARPGDGVRWWALLLVYSWLLALESGLDLFFRPWDVARPILTLSTQGAALAGLAAMTGGWLAGGGGPPAAWITALGTTATILALLWRQGRTLFAWW